MDIRLSNDGTFSAYDVAFGECYHSLKDGALSETLYKHIFPALAHCGILKESVSRYTLDETMSYFSHNAKIPHNARDSADSATQIPQNSALSPQIPPNSRDTQTPRIPQDSQIPPTQTLNVLDICFGLGYNTFALLSTLTALNFRGKILLYSPEQNRDLFPALRTLEYPPFFTKTLCDFAQILESLQDSSPKISLNLPFEAQLVIYKGDALDFIREIPAQSLHIVFQDAFSPPKNPALWSAEYFALLYEKLHAQGIITSYSLARSVRQNATNAGFLIYRYDSGHTRESSLFSKIPLNLKNTKRYAQ